VAAIHAPLARRPYSDDVADDLHEDWPKAGHGLLAELAAARGRVALVGAGDLLAADGLVERLQDDLNLAVVPLGKALADGAEPPTAEEISQEAAEEELATFAITSLREHLQEAAVVVARLRVARVVADRRAKAAADSEYPHIRELASGIEQDLRSANLNAVLGLANILWRRYRQGIDTDPSANVPIWDDLHATIRLQEALQHVNETFGDADEDADVLDNDAFDTSDDDFTRGEDP
jgi:hypothetical protein